MLLSQPRTRQLTAAYAKWFHAVAVAVCVAFSFVAWILVIVARLADKLVKKYERKEAKDESQSNNH